MNRRISRLAAGSALGLASVILSAQQLPPWDISVTEHSSAPSITTTIAARTAEYRPKDPGAVFTVTLKLASAGTSAPFRGVLSDIVVADTAGKTYSCIGVAMGGRYSLGIPAEIDGFLVLPSKQARFMAMPDGTGSLSFEIGAVGGQATLSLGLEGTATLGLAFAVPRGVDVIELRWPGRAPIALPRVRNVGVE